VPSTQGLTSLNASSPVILRRSAGGLLWIAEVIEEHTKLAKKIGRRSIYVRPLASG
jgi:hypothetical protein